LAVVVTAASVQAGDGATQLLATLPSKFSRLRLIWANQAFAGDLIASLWVLRPWRTIRLAMVKRPEGIKGFLLLPKRWIVERTFAWLSRYRRLVVRFIKNTQVLQLPSNGAAGQLRVVFDGAQLLPQGLSVGGGQTSPETALGIGWTGLRTRLTGAGRLPRGPSQ
jgi:transposase